MAYFPPSHPDFNGLRHLLLLYGDARRPWTQEQLLSGVAHQGASGRPDDWFFDSFLFLNVKASSDRDYCADVNLGTTMCGEGDFFAMCSPQPAVREDWEELLDFYFGAGGALQTLDRTVAGALEAIGRPYGHRRNVVLMLPYPHITQRVGTRRSGQSPRDDAPGLRAPTPPQVTGPRAAAVTRRQRDRCNRQNLRCRRCRAESGARRRRSGPMRPLSTHARSRNSIPNLPPGPDGPPSRSQNARRVWALCLGSEGAPGVR